eukprot:XP_003970813.1 PREDICTED: glutaredoxin domain-containing cysteine-rich protein 2 [Takifugu rubripes]
MEKPQRKPNPWHEGTKPRKVRFKLASSYSGRVLKHVYEDGQELDSPEEKYPHSFIHHKIPPDHLEVGQLLEFEDNQEDQQDPPPGLMAHRINVYRGRGGYRPGTDQCQAAETGAAEANTCRHCGGSGFAPCSLCHGSKLSMLANRFNESISDLRCQACYPHGLEKCQSCSSRQHCLVDSGALQRNSQ